MRNMHLVQCISNFWWSNCYNTSTTFQKQNQFILIMSHFHAVKQNRILCIILNHLFCSKHFKNRWIDQGYGQGDLKCRPLLLSERSPLIFYMQGKLITFFSLFVKSPSEDCFNHNFDDAVTEQNKNATEPSFFPDPLETADKYSII